MYRLAAQTSLHSKTPTHHSKNLGPPAAKLLRLACRHVPDLDTKVRIVDQMA